MLPNLIKLYCFLFLFCSLSLLLAILLTLPPSSSFGSLSNFLLLSNRFKTSGFKIQKSLRLTFRLTFNGSDCLDFYSAFAL